MFLLPWFIYTAHQHMECRSVYKRWRRRWWCPRRRR